MGSRPAATAVGSDLSCQSKEQEARIIADLNNALQVADQLPPRFAQISHAETTKKYAHIVPHHNKQATHSTPAPKPTQASLSITTNETGVAAGGASRHVADLHLASDVGREPDAALPGTGRSVLGVVVQPTKRGVGEETRSACVGL